MAIGLRGRRWDTAEFNFNYFDNIADFFALGETAYNWCLNNYVRPTIMVGSGRRRKLGLGQTYAQKSDKDKFDNWKRQDDYQFRDDLFTGLERLETARALIDMGGTFTKQRLEITSDTRGVFSFGLASRGLFKPVEFFSQELAQDNPKEFPEYPSGIVPPLFVNAITIGDMKQFWYTSQAMGKKYQLVRQQEGKREVDLGVRENPVFRTKTKKSYIIFPKQGGKAKLVEVFIPLHGTIGLTNVMPLYLAIRYLKEVGISVRVNSMRIYYDSILDKWFGWVVTVKDFGEEVDYNQLAKCTVDRNWWFTMENNLMSINNYNKQATDTKGWGDDAGNEWDYQDVFARWKNWYFEKMALGEVPQLRVDKKLLLFGGSFTDTSDEAQIKEFLRIVDMVDFQFNKEEACLKKIYEREVGENLEKYRLEQEMQNWNGASQLVIDNLLKTKKESLTDQFRKYITKLLEMTYSYPKVGEYAESLENAEKLENEFDEKIVKVNQFLKNIV